LSLAETESADMIDAAYSWSIFSVA
jgi:hypothetical protein